MAARHVAALLLAFLAVAHADVAAKGSSAIEKPVLAIIEDFDGATVTYDPAGSGAGVDCALDGSCDIGAGDVPIPADKFQEGVLTIPVMVGAIVVGHSAPDGAQVQLSACALSGIYTGAITTWGDDLIVADNPDFEGSTLAVTPVARSDSSGSTAVFTAYLSEACPDTWTTGSSKVVDWADNIVQMEGTSAVVEAVLGTEGSIGYASAGRFELDNEVAIEDAVGDFVRSDSTTFGPVGEAEVPAPDADWSDVEFIFEEGAFPTEFVGLFFVQMTITDETKAFIEFVLSDDAQGRLEEFAFRALPDNLKAAADAGVALLQVA